jgi:lysophospholipid acyltransferase (LPLAT)-like uncharacterized protein
VRLSSRRLANAPWVQKTVGVLAAEYLRLVWRSSRVTTEPPDIYEVVRGDVPIILAMWHGQHFLMPFLKQDEHRAKVLISHHRDGEINARAAQRLGVGVIRGSGTHGGDMHKKGGVTAFREMLTALEDGYNVALTADVPKVSRVCGLGIVKLASMSGRPIYPIAIATSRRVTLDSWDRSVVNLPFGRAVSVAETAVRVPPDADAETLQRARREVEAALNTATARAYALVDGKPEGGGRG